MNLMVFAETFTLEPLPPFCLDCTAQIFRLGDKQIRSFVEGVFRQVLNIDGDLVLAQVSSNSDREKPLLTVVLKSNKPKTASNKTNAKEAIKHIFNLDFDLASFYQEVAGDPVMSKIAKQLRGYKFPTTITAFEALVDAIVEQQISIKVARTIEERLVSKFGDKLELDGESFFSFPSAQKIAAASISDIQQVGLSKRKAEYIHNATQLIVSGQLDLEAMKNQKDMDKIIAKLDEIKGIGVWTAELTLLRGMQRWDILPADDFGIRRVISTYYAGGRPIKTNEAREIAKNWGKWQGLAAFYLIIAEEKGIVV
jgi:DNA-3-methyladenine glycosylase II